ncbi:MAG: hypothetical protein WCJ19_03320 [bacterium]
MANNGGIIQFPGAPSCGNTASHLKVITVSTRLEALKNPAKQIDLKKVPKSIKEAVLQLIENKDLKSDEYLFRWKVERGLFLPESYSFNNKGIYLRTEFEELTDINGIQTGILSLVEFANGGVSFDFAYTIFSGITNLAHFYALMQTVRPKR